MGKLEDRDKAAKAKQKEKEKSFISTSTLTPKIDFLNEKIEIDVLVKMDGKITNHYKEIINLKEKMIRDALISLGWTPPVASNNSFNLTKTG